jgi:excisionase family DNA binding protein
LTSSTHADILSKIKQAKCLSSKCRRLSKLTAFISRRKEKMTQVATSELLTVSEVADILRVDATTVRRWVKNDVLKAVVLPHVNRRQSYRVRRDTLNKVLEGTQETVEA